MGQLVFGVDIGGTAIKTGLFDEECRLLQKWECDTVKTGDGRDIIKSAASFIMDKIHELKLDINNIKGIGAGIPGPVTDKGEVKELANLGMGYFNIEEVMGGLTGLKVRAGNDANVAALGELRSGSGKGFKSMVFVTLGTGVGGGIILNGRIHAGSSGAAGEIGHIMVNRNETRECGCKKKGCLEQYASATGIVRLAGQMIDETREASSLRELTVISAKDVFDHAKSGDALALKVIDKACLYLGIALAHVDQVMDPEAFIIGGGVSKAGKILIDTVKEHYESYVMDTLKGKEFRLASLGNDAGIYGCAGLILASE
jgi:glucokinase